MGLPAVGTESSLSTMSSYEDIQKENEELREQNTILMETHKKALETIESLKSQVQEYKQENLNLSRRFERSITNINQRQRHVHETALAAEKNSEHSIKTMMIAAISGVAIIAAAVFFAIASTGIFSIFKR